MYYYLRGTIALHEKNNIVVDCNGIGYYVYVSRPDDFPIGELMTVYTSMYFREDEQYLVGFKTFEEKQVFNKLLTVKGVGPKIAVSALAGATPEQLIDAIEKSNVLFLKKLPGIGPKAANQIVLDLRGKLTYSSATLTGDKNMDDAMVGLRQFGFTVAEINAAFTKITERGLTTEEYVRRGLALLNRN